MTTDNPQPTVYVVDDDADIRTSIQWLLESVGLKVGTFESAEAFFESGAFREPGCLLLDVRMPGIGGMRLLDKLNAEGSVMPVILLTGYGEVSMAVQSMKSGAFDFLEKPVNHQRLIERVQEALAQDEQKRQRVAESSETEAMLALLTKREREILDHLVEGRSSRVVAEILGISERTVEKHRERLISKMNARTVVQLVRRVTEYRASQARHGTS